MNDEEATFDQLLDGLRVNPLFARYDAESLEEGTRQRLGEFKAQTLRDLSRLLELLRLRQDAISLAEQARVVSVMSAFQGDDPWISEENENLSSEVLNLLDTRRPLIEIVLTEHVKPLFSKNPHPSIHTDTGRKLARPAGGPLASQDLFDSQTWKTHPGAANLVHWCARNIREDDFERIWHLVIPPVMTLLDDYEGPYRLKGIRIVGAMLERAPGSLLKRTGVDELIFSSLQRSFAYLQSPSSPAIICSSIKVGVSLVKRTHDLGSEKYFNQLCGLLGEGIIGSVWMYASLDADSVLASIDALPDAVRALGIGSVRYLKAIVPQLVHPLLPEISPQHFQLQLSSLRALDVVIVECAPRIPEWKDMILEGVVKCWLSMEDSEVKTQDSTELRSSLQRICERLAKTCPSIVEEELKVLREHMLVGESLRELFLLV